MKSDDRILSNGNGGAIPKQNRKPLQASGSNNEKTCKPDIKDVGFYPVANTSNSQQVEVNSANKREVIYPKWFNQAAKKLKEELREEITKEILCKISASFMNAADLQSPTNTSTNISSSTQTTVLTSVQSTSEKVIHNGIICDNCEHQIEGIRYKCSSCPDYDLCENCEAMSGIHFEKHNFLKIRQPLIKNSKSFNGNDIYLALDVDLPSGKVEIGDIHFGQKPTSNPASVNVSMQKESCPAKHKREYSDKKTAKLAKKLLSHHEKIK